MGSPDGRTGKKSEIEDDLSNTVHLVGGGRDSDSCSAHSASVDADSSVKEAPEEAAAEAGHHQGTIKRRAASGQTASADRGRGDGEAAPREVLAANERATTKDAGIWRPCLGRDPEKVNETADRSGESTKMVLWQEKGSPAPGKRPGGVAAGGKFSPLHDGTARHHPGGGDEENGVSGATRGRNQPVAGIPCGGTLAAGGGGDGGAAPGRSPARVRDESVLLREKRAKAEATLGSHVQVWCNRALPQHHGQCIQVYSQQKNTPIAIVDILNIYTEQ